LWRPGWPIALPEGQGRRPNRISLRSIVKNHVQQGTVDFDAAVVVNKAQLPKSTGMQLFAGLALVAAGAISVMTFILFTGVSSLRGPKRSEVGWSISAVEAVCNMSTCSSVGCLYWGIAARATTVAGDDGTQLNVPIFAGYCAYQRYRRCPKEERKFRYFLVSAAALGQGNAFPYLFTCSAWT
jgi:hypothetical protein